MKQLLTLVLAGALCGPALAEDMVAKSGSDYIRLTEAPCLGEYVPEADRGSFRAAYAQVDGESFKACWSMRAGGQVIIAYEDGDWGLVPSHEFKPYLGV